MQNVFLIDRLSIKLLETGDWDFMLELLNTKGWIEFIGDRNVHSKDEAIAYIDKIINTKDLFYWVVRLRSNETPIGIISFIKRSYLEYFDIGFAFLPAFGQNGYAYEAARHVLTRMGQSSEHPVILATTIPSNINSTRLLTKLGMFFMKEIEIENKKLLLYSTGTGS